MDFDKEKLTESFKKNLERGRAGAVGIGVFAAVFNSDNKMLLRKRMEKGSLIYNGDLSGKWELPGGGVELVDFRAGEYQSSIWNCIQKELQEEVCIVPSETNKQLVMLPAWLGKEDNIDLAFVIPFSIYEMEPSGIGEYFNSYYEGLEKNAIGYFTEKEIERLEIISPRMKMMILEAFRYCH
ncbi:MAG: NUDIX domain-containing protein [Candidatus Paceibacterota bacterium]|jgi:8-oxo-dGTP pyrophosphatase MutT (NUDIX family)|nr:NUDIX domain-containing protein [bacterium]